MAELSRGTPRPSSTRGTVRSAHEDRWILVGLGRITGGMGSGLGHTCCWLTVPIDPLRRARRPPRRTFISAAVHPDGNEPRAAGQPLISGFIMRPDYY